LYTINNEKHILLKEGLIFMTKDYRRYDVVLVDFGTDTIGSEQGGVRPAVVVQNDKGNIHSTTTIVMPLSSKIKTPYMPTHAMVRKGREKGLRRDSVVLGEALRQVSEIRIKKWIGKIVDESEQQEIRQAFIANFGN
jgi:mRNA interferase MazF